MRFQKALFMSNFGIDMGLPEFRVGSYATYLLPFSKTFEKATGGESKFLLGSHTLDLLSRKTKVTEINEQNSFVIKNNDYAKLFGLGDDFIVESYNDTLDANLERYTEYFLELFSGWQPDIIFCWEFPTTLFRKIFPNALVLDIMPGAYMRPPYPKTISIDPVGLYRESFLKTFDGTQSFETLGDTSEFLKIRDLYSTYFNQDTDVQKVILDLVDPSRKFDKYWLVPMQISSYFGFYENCKYKDQFDFLIDILSKAPDNVGVIATQYIGSLVSEKTLNNRNLGYIRNLHPNFLYSTEFEKLDNISQYIVPWVDTVVTVSSTLGFQALLHGKKLNSPSTSHLSYIASSLTEADRESNQAFVASLMCRQNVLVEKFLNDTEYFKSILIGLSNRNSDSTFDVLAAFPQPENLYKDYLSLSPFSGADNQIKKMGGIISSKKNSLRGLMDRIDKYDVVSFDIFDTLLRRTLFKPEDAFLLIQKKLENEYPGLLPHHLMKRLPELRVGFERQLRKEHDDLQAATDVSAERNEEFFTIEVYRRLLSAFGLNTELAETLLSIEQTVELSILEARSLGRALYDYAVAKEKRVILVSDFTHTESFVASALAAAGYTEHEKLYVSSEIGLKKHSGNLFNYVLRDLNLKAEAIIHIGDNSQGDFLRAIDAGIYPTKIFSSRERANQIFRARGFDLGVFDNSLYLRTAVNLYAEQYYDALLAHGDKPLEQAKERRDAFSTPGEFGFLAIAPMLYEFTKWILDAALKQNCRKILFFARDCYLPFEIARKLVARVEKYKGLEPVYLAVSRKALTCLNLHEPNDCLKVRLDDFSRNKTLSELLSSRFKIEPSRMGADNLAKWNIDSVETLVKDTTLGAIYGLVHEYLSEDWEAWSATNTPNKEALRAYLRNNNLSAHDDVVAVDFGYKGSAHSVVSEYFSAKFIPLFFMTYSGETGGEPFPKAQAYLFESMNVRHKTSTPVISHNLIVETLVNEPTGSLVSYQLKDDQVHLEREECDNDLHIAKIRAIHNGVLEFSDLWIKKIEHLGVDIALEQNSATYLLSMFFSRPCNMDLDLLKGLVFDNAYAGAENTYILSPRVPNDKDVWKEGVTLWKNNGKATGAVATAANNVKNLTTALVKAAVPQLAEAQAYTGLNSYKSVKSLHRSQFLQALSSIAFPGKKCQYDQGLIELVPSKGKNFVAIEFLRTNGGLWNSKLSIKDKIYLATRK